ncbi:Oidioi.mRNA.OKI2018_I69.chr2.g8029.t1.cds [Oikopleura dioica]|uniref:Oidioi.mRNA.OKI2018_I69.chr2.g8029.t1.cds n=1 Tax=Oikopleura dioica TaxID=34765 RepID=A0ABN7T8J8_OIKDI|nr:Oidioi.mRNA.OKI2018_I69.chr2.g8029.t1.cds [Oikopleura dioica]
MQFEENENFEIVLPRKKKSNSKNIKQINLDEVKVPVRKSSSFHDDEGIGSASPTYESDDHRNPSAPVTQPKKKSKPSKKKQGKKNAKKKANKANNSKPKETPKEEENHSEANNNNHESCSATASPESDAEAPSEHRRRRKSSRCDGDGNEIRHRRISWAEELVLEPSRVRTCSEGSILNKDGNDWSVDHYVCDCGFAGCDCDETSGAIHPEWTPRNIQWNCRYRSLSSMKKSELNFIEQKFYYCDSQRHLKLGTGTSVYFALGVDGQEHVARKLKTKQLPQLKPSLVKNLLKIRHPNLIKYQEFIILKNQTYVLQELVDFSLGRWLENKTICQPLDKLNLCHQLVAGIQYLHENNIAHKDLRPVNVLLNQSGRLIVTNFGIVPHIAPNKGKTTDQRLDELRTSSAECWRASETIWQITEDFQIESDIPPLGMMIYTILTDGQHPYGLSGRRESVKLCIKNMMTPRYCLNLLNGNVFAKELVRKMLQKDPKSRITATDAFKDSLFWTRQQKLEHIEHILTGPKSSALENQSSRCFIPICGHFGNLPAILSSAHDADTGHEALDNLATAFAEISPIDSPNHREHFLEGILESLPQLVPLTQQHAKIEIECALEIGEVDYESSE